MLASLREFEVEFEASPESPATSTQAEPKVALLKISECPAMPERNNSLRASKFLEAAHRSISAVCVLIETACIIFYITRP